MNGFKSAKQLGTRLFIALVFLLPLIAASTIPAGAKSEDAARAVYTITNATNGNAVAVYNRANDGSLSFQASYPAGGSGSGVDLGSQGSVILSENGRRLFTVDAGSNQISAFAVSNHGLDLLDVANSGGTMPISLTTNGRVLYVLNAGGSGNISGFQIGDNGKLAALKGSTQPLSNGGSGTAPQPAQISFSPDGRLLVVTEKATNLIDTYEVKNGIAGHPVTHPSAGMTPFGFAFARGHDLIVSEAFGSAPNASAVSSYQVDQNTFKVISPSVKTTQTAACWVAISNNNKYAYVTNADSGSISSYRIDKNGAITLLDAQAGLTGNGSGPIDMAFSSNGQYLYALGSKSNAINIFRVQENGSLKLIGNINVPATAVGLAAR